MTIEDQLTVQRNWNLHPNNPNPDMTGQVRMEINEVTNPVQNTPVIYAATNPTPTGAPTFVTECEDTLNHLTLNHLGNC